MINLTDHKDKIIARLQKMSPKELQNRLQAKGYDVIVTKKHMKNKKTPTNTESLIRLKNQGFDVKIKHYRMVTQRDDNMGWKAKLTPDFEWRENINTGYYDLPNEKGGATDLILIRGEEKIVVRASCYAKDHFCRRVGVLEALKKLKKLHGIEA